MVIVNVSELFSEAVEVSKAADAFDDLVEFDETTDFVSRASAAQEVLFNEIMESLHDIVLTAASGGNKSAELLKFRGSDLYDGFSILFLLFGGVDHERRDQLEHFGFRHIFQKLKETLRPFVIEHYWCKATNFNYITVYWD